MSFNHYSIYSIVSVTEGHNNDDIQNIFNISDTLKQIKSAEKAKSYLKTAFKLELPVRNYPIGNNASITIDEDDKLYSINLVFGNENMTFAYVKVKE